KYPGCQGRGSNRRTREPGRHRLAKRTQPAASRGIVAPFGALLLGSPVLVELPLLASRLCWGQKRLKGTPVLFTYSNLPVGEVKRSGGEAQRGRTTRCDTRFGIE